MAWRAVGSPGVRRVMGALLPAPRSAFPLGHMGCPGTGGNCWSWGQPPRGCGDARLLCHEPLPSPTGAVPATGFLKQSGINIDSKGFIVVNKVSVGSSPHRGGEEEEMSLLQGILRAELPRGSERFICRGAEMLRCWEHRAGALGTLLPCK